VGIVGFVSCEAKSLICRPKMCDVCLIRYCCAKIVRTHVLEAIDLDWIAIGQNNAQV